MVNNYFNCFYKADQQKLKQYSAQINSKLFGYHKIRIDYLGDYQVGPKENRKYQDINLYLRDCEVEEDYDAISNLVRNFKDIVVMGWNDRDVNDAEDCNFRIFLPAMMTVILKELSILHYNNVELSNLYEELYDDYTLFITERMKDGTFDKQFKSVYDSIVKELDKYDDLYV